MSRKFIIVLAITTLFTALVVGFSWIYLSQLLRQRLLWADETASQLTNQLEYAASRAVPDLTSTRVDTNNPKALRAAITNYLHADTNLNDMLESVVGNSRIIYGPATVYDVSIGLELDGQAFGSVHVGVSTVFLRNELTPKLQQAAFFSVVAIFCSLVLSAVVSNVALGPLKAIARNLDTASAGVLLPDEDTGDE